MELTLLELYMRRDALRKRLLEIESQITEKERLEDDDFLKDLRFPSGHENSN